MTTQTMRAGGATARFAAERPEFWVYPLVLCAWGVMTEHAVRHGVHLHHHVMPPPLEAAHWVLMIVAMMLPLQIESLRWVAFRSYRHRRLRSTAASACGYLGAWALAAIPVILLRALPAVHDHRAASLAFAVAALWAVLPWYRQRLEACHWRRPLVPNGWRATTDALAYGGELGWRCVAVCWPLMLGCALTGHAMSAMVGGAAISASERLAFRSLPARTAAGCLALAAWQAWLSFAG